MANVPPDSETHAMLDRYYRLWKGQQIDEIVACFTDDAVFEDLALGARFEGHKGVRRFAQITFASVPDFAIEPVSVICEGDQAAASWVMTGTHTGDLPGAPATGRAFEIRASSIIELRGLKIARMCDYWNPKALEAPAGTG